MTKFTQEQVDELNSKIKTTEEALQWVSDNLHPKVAKASSFGAEDAVVMDIMLKINPKFRFFTLDTGRLPQETYDIMDVVRKKYNVTIEVLFPDTQEVQNMVNEKGLNLFYDSVENRKLCCEIRKVHPMNKMLATLDGWITGLRRDQTKIREDVSMFQIDNGHGGILKINPIIDWSWDQIQEYIKKNNLPYNSLLDKGYPSIGCEPCTRAIKPGEDLRAGRWWWEQDEHKECGLHIDHNRGLNMSENNSIKPHGGVLINRIKQVDPSGLFSITISEDLANDVENIADGIFSPLEGFLGKEDFESVVSRGRLANDLAWTIPIVLDVDEQIATKMKESGDVLLQTPQGVGVAVIHVDKTYSFDKEKTAQGVYGTTDTSHLGVAKTMSMKDFLVGGKIDYIQRPEETEIRKYRLTPTQTREAFAQAGWKTICAFQTRNPPHVAHEMLQKTSITTRDGVFVNPIIGKKKSGDFVDEVIVKCYETMIKLYYPENRCRLGTLHTEMKYAGPKEAIHHAIMRQNYGCTHIIIGRDHAGVGKFYDPFAAQKIFDDYPELEISPVFFPAFFYCRKCLTYTTPKACPHDDAKEQISGTKLREMIQNGQSPSEFILRPEVAKVILDHPKPFVD